MDELRRRIDVTTTATLRPELLDQTLSSFFENMLGGSAQHVFQYRHILNIDCIGDDCVPYDVIDVSIKHFGAAPIVRISEEPNFARAVRWVWQQARADYVLNLEDDWLLVSPVSIVDMVSFLDLHRDFALLRLNKFEAQWRKKPQRYTARQWNRHMLWNDDLKLYEVPTEYKVKLGFSGNPSLVRREFMHACADFIRVEQWDPEYQLHGCYEDACEEMLRWRYGIWQPLESHAQIKDLGRVWCDEHHWHKHRGLGFVTWEKINGQADE